LRFKEVEATRSYSNEVEATLCHSSEVEATLREGKPTVFPNPFPFEGGYGGVAPPIQL